MKYSEPQYTKDLDVWVYNSPENSIRLFRALAKFGAPLEQDGITAETFTNNIVYQIGIAPVRVDFLTSITGVQFPQAWKRRVNSIVFGVSAPFISLEDLIANKQAAGRWSDLEHLQHIQESMRNKQ
jgi:predicted nucleotidyltransferase